MPKIPWLTLCMVFHAQSLSFSSLFLQNSDIVRQNITRKLCAGGGHSAHHACTTPIPDLINPLIPSLRVQPFWLLVASLVRGVDMPLMQCPYYQCTGTHFTDLGRMTGWVNPLVLIQRKTGLELRTLGSQATTITAKPTSGLNLIKGSIIYNLIKDKVNRQIV